MAVFGRGLRSEWLLDPAVTYLNHGTVGAPPRRVLEAQRAIVDEIERQPAKFMLRELADTSGTAGEALPRIRQAAAHVARFVGVHPDDLVFVDNITAGANAVLRSFPLKTGDELLVTNLGYGGVSNTARFAARQAGATCRTIDLPSPGASPEEFVDAVERGLGDHTRLIVIDHITASTALILPLAQIAAACHRRGVLVFADGAHVPGNIPLDISALGVDWYAANLHKWAWAPRSAGILWAAAEHQAGLHPTVISWGLDNGFAAEFDLLGTRDPSAFLASPFAIDLMRGYGIESIHTWNHDLAVWSGAYLADRWGVKFATPAEMLGAMVNVSLPAQLGTTDAEAAALRAALDGDGFEIPIYAERGQLSLRISAQIYNDRADIEALADAVCRRI